jgi:hypothetical protein
LGAALVAQANRTTAKQRKYPLEAVLMKAAKIKTILTVSCALVFTAALVPTSRADVWTVNPNGRVTSNRATTAAGNQNAVAAQSASGTRTGAGNAARTQARDSGRMSARGGQAYPRSRGRQQWNGVPYPSPGYAYGVPNYGYYPAPYPVYEPPYIAPVAPDPYGSPAWVSSFPTGGTTYYYPYLNPNYCPPQSVSPPVIVSPYYPYILPYGTAMTGTGSISTSTNTVIGGLSFNTGLVQGPQIGVVQPWIGGIYGKSSSNTTTTVVVPLR